MANKRFEIELPKEAVDELHLKDGEQFDIQVSNQAFKVLPNRKTEQNQNQQLSIRRFLIPSILASAFFAFFTIWQNENLVPLTGTNSIATWVIFLGEITGMATFMYTHLQSIWIMVDPVKKKVARRLAPTLFFSFALIQAFTSVALFWAIGYLFQAASFDSLTATLIFFIFISVENYVMIYSATLISTTFMMFLLIITIVCGVLVAMVTNSRLLWWQHNFSFLGTAKADFSWTFNATLMVAGLLWATLIDYLFVPIQNRIPRNWRLILLRAFLTFDALCLFAIGALPNDPGILHIAHDTAANFLILGTGLPMISIRFLLPNASREFFIFSFSTAIGMLLSSLLFYGIHYFSLTAFEIFVLTMGISWLLLLMQNIHELYEIKDNTYSFTLKALN
ncbi:DUF998 domain-containing protein [Fructobacillus fructosus]|uniref:Transcriptional regulator n=1 Tax=Fructobacillus fructosus TaxID=1631 RepID=A0ABM9MXN5_9LACO|nr:DUF998 domain-containing protein [Fructobacillus fructosus]MBD9366071.1 DUF998 domain-containing protein [Leuconostoc mesenteroides]MBC9119117.1 DUF998 domain-containing protein [Fructobacillus fructosus]MCK8638678.1 DUF998 domain-containing protein [Fructobacillus fructosus]CAK1241657.1 hypothetical protein R53140_OCIKHKEL_00938 [Fructobacillus fructosus]CAK1247551.1 hypothetical protein R54839_PPFHFPJH_01198 [Fructobacillus fructosus]